MNETTENEVIETATPEAEAPQTTPEAAPEAAPEATPEATPETAPRKKQGKPVSPSMEERMLEMLLREKHSETLEKALAEGKTIHGAWNYVVSVMKNAYIAEHGKVNGGCCGNADVVVAIAERYLREFPEGTVEPETSHTPKKPTQKTDTKAETKSVAKKVVATAKAAAKAAKAEAKRKAKKIADAVGTQQLFFNL